MNRGGKELPVSPPTRGRGGKRGRGRPLKINKSVPITDVDTDKVQQTLSLLSFPVDERDEDVVECDVCNERMSYRLFRIHNFQDHYNIANITDDPQIKDYKYYNARLKLLSKFKKISVFTCPRNECAHRYKSALGLAYHLETCGKESSELESVMVECDVCGGKFISSNLPWHKKKEHTEVVVREPSQNVVELEKVQRKSAIKAIQTIQQSKKADDDDPEMKQEPEDADVQFDYEPDISHFFCEEVKEEPDEIYSQSEMTNEGVEIGAQICKYIEGLKEEGNAWDTPIRNLIDPFPDLYENSFKLLPKQICKEYLPQMKQSVSYRTKVRIGKAKPKLFQSSEFHRLSLFDSELTDGSNPNTMAFTGGPISALAWHPSGKWLAVATYKELKEEPNCIKAGNRKTVIQIYENYQQPSIEENTFSALALKFLIGLDVGYINDMCWGNFWPIACDTVSSLFFPEHGNLDSMTRIGYLAIACEDSTCRIISIGNKTLNSWSKCYKSSDYSIHQKQPEIVLRIDEDIYPEVGQCTRLDWHENNKFLVVGYGTGIVAIFDLFTNSSLLRKETFDAQIERILTFLPFWTLSAHVMPVVGVHFDPSCCRYLLTTSFDGIVRFWDVDLRTEIEKKKVGRVLASRWIRGWIHYAISVDIAMGNMSSLHNYTRYFQVGSKNGRPNALEYFNITCLDFFEGMTLQGMETGKVNVSYYDQFWRDCDFERNKRKRNIVNISEVSLDKSSYTQLNNKLLLDPEATIDLFEEEPRIEITFQQERTHHASVSVPDQDYLKSFARFFHYVRVNKVAWSPTGEHIVIGYKNGLIALLPANFTSLFLT